MLADKKQTLTAAVPDGQKFQLFQNPCCENFNELEKLHKTRARSPVMSLLANTFRRPEPAGTPCQQNVVVAIGETAALQSLNQIAKQFEAPR
jgi:hypothetical protein